MEESEILNYVDVLPAEHPYVSENCLELFLEEFAFEKFLDVGNDGVVVMVHTIASPFQFYALKISKYDDLSRNAIVAASLLE